MSAFVEPTSTGGVPVVFDLHETAGRLRISYAMVRKLVREGRIQSFRVGDRRLVSADALSTFIAAQVAAESAKGR